MHRTRNRFPVVALAALALVAVGCSDDGTVAPTAASGELSAQMAEITLEADLIMEALLGSHMVSPAVSASSSGVAAAVVTEEFSFSRTRDCPAGGEMTVEGQMTRTWDSETHTMEGSFSGSRTMVDCAFHRGEYTITINGAATWEATRRRVNGRPDGPQTTHIAGEFHAVRSDGEEKTCSFEVTIVRDPDAMTREMTGNFCGDFFRRVVAWHHDG